MITKLLFSFLLSVLFYIPSILALPDHEGKGYGFLSERFRRSRRLEKRSSVNYNPDGSPFLWLPQDEYSGRTFFEYAIPDILNWFESDIDFFQPLDVFQPSGPN